MRREESNKKTKKEDKKKICPLTPWFRMEIFKKKF